MGDTKQKKPTPLDRGPPLHVNRVLITLSDEKSGTMLFRALKTGFVEKKGQSGPLSVVSKTQGKCQFGYLSVKILAICQLSVNPIQSLSKAWIKPFEKKNAIFWTLKNSVFL